MKQSVLTIMQRVVLTMICGVVAAFFGASLASAAEVSTTNQSGSGREITQGDVSRVVISDVTRSSTTSANGRTITQTIRFTITANNANVYVPTVTTGREGTIIWRNAGFRTITSTFSSDATTEGGRYVVSEGESETFVITIMTNGRSEIGVQAIRFSNSATGRLTKVQFPRAEQVTLPERPRPGVTPVASTSPVKVYCVSGRENFPAGTERTSITNASGTTSVISDGRFVCRVKDGRGVWEREGSLPRPGVTPVASTSPVKTPCINGSVANSRIQPSGGFSIARPGTQECIGGTSSSTGSTTDMTGGTSVPKPPVLPKPCAYLNKTYTDGTRQPNTTGSGFMNNRMSPLVCQNGQWRPLKQPLASTTNHSIGSTTRSGQVRGVSLSVPERQKELQKLHTQLTSLVAQMTKPSKHEGQFKVGDSVVTTDVLKVRARGAGGVLGIQPLGAAGVIVADWTNAADRGWYKVDFVTGVDGWVAASYLKSNVVQGAVTISFTEHRDLLATSTIVATEGGSESLSPLAYLMSVSGNQPGMAVAIEKLAVSFTVTNATFAEVVDSAVLSINGSDYGDVIFTTTNGTVTTLVFNINEPIVIESDNEALVEVRVALKDTIAQLAEDFTIAAKVSTTEELLTGVSIQNATVTYAGDAVGNVHTIVVTE